LLLSLTAGPARSDGDEGDDDFLGPPLVSARRLEDMQPGQQAAVEHAGPGWLHSAQIVKVGGKTGETYVSIEIDGRVLYGNSFATLKNPWMQIDTLFMLANVRQDGDSETMTVWYTPALQYRDRVSVRVEVQEPGVRAVYISALHSLPRDEVR
jgi:hypothetical protein